MGVPAIGTRTSGSYGVEKTDAKIDPTITEDKKVPSAEHNRIVDGLIASEEAIGLDSDVANPSGSHEARIKDHEARIAALEALITP